MGVVRHAHRFMHESCVDGCHWQMAWGMCECGAQLNATFERDIRKDPDAATWMQPVTVLIGGEDYERDARGRFVKRYEVTDCRRCKQLQRGAVPVVRLLILAADGAVELDYTGTET